MTPLQTKIQDITQRFAAELLTAFSEGLLENLSGLPGRANGATAAPSQRRGRPPGSKNKPKAAAKAKGRRRVRTAEEIERDTRSAAKAIAAALRKTPNIGREAIEAAAKLDEASYNEGIRRLRDERRVMKHGDKRGATWTLVSGTKPARKTQNKKTSKKTSNAKQAEAAA